MAGGSYLVARKIAMLIETWDRVRLSEQDRIIGRDEGRGRTALRRRRVHRARLPRETDAAGAPKIPVDSHVRLAHPDFNDGIRILRRGYNFVDGNNDLGRLDAGLFFLSYQRAPSSSSRVQRSLSTDAHERVHPPRAVGALGRFRRAPTAGSYVGAGLFA